MTDTPQPANTNAATPATPPVAEPMPTIVTPSNKEVVIIAEHFKGTMQPVTYELLGIGRDLADKLGGKLSCFLLGFNVKEQAQSLIAAGADVVYLADHPELELYRTLPYKRVITDHIKSWDLPPHIVLLGSSTTGRDLAPRVAACLGTGLTADCTELDIGPYEHTNKADPDKLGIYPGCLYAFAPALGKA